MTRGRESEIPAAGFFVFLFVVLYYSNYSMFLWLSRLLIEFPQLLHGVMCKTYCLSIPELLTGILTAFCPLLSSEISDVHLRHFLQQI